MYWNVDPILAEVGPLTIRWYGVLFATAFLCGYALVRRIFLDEGEPERDLDALLIYMMVGTIVGARLGHILFYNPAHYLSHPAEIVKVWHGGLASHGGAIGIFTALYFYVRRRPNQSYLWLLDRIAVPTALGGFFIRTGNLFNSEILGTPSDLPWAMTFARVDLVPRHPAQMYEALGYLAIFVVLVAVYRRLRARTPRGLLVGLFLTLVFTHRFLIELVKTQQAAFADVLPLSMGQLLSLPMVGLGVLLLARAIRNARAHDVSLTINLTSKTMRHQSTPITSPRHWLWKSAGILAASLLIVLLVKNLSVEPPATGAATEATASTVAPHFWQKEDVRTVLVAAAGDPAPERISTNEALSATLVEGTLPEGATQARVLTDQDCAPDAQGLSHCLNRLDVNGTEVIVRHHHNMHRVPCLSPAEVINLQRI